MLSFSSVCALACSLYNHTYHRTLNHSLHPHSWKWLITIGINTYLPHPTLCFKTTSFCHHQLKAHPCSISHMVIHTHPFKLSTQFQYTPLSPLCIQLTHSDMRVIQNPPVVDSIVYWVNGWLVLCINFVTNDFIPLLVIIRMVILRLWQMVQIFWKNLESRQQINNI